MKHRPEFIAQVFEHFSPLRDRRIDRRKFHSLINIIVMALCGSIGGADGWKDLALFAKSKEDWFRTVLDLKRGTPSADTFRRVLSRLDPVAFETCFRQFVRAMAHDFAGEVIAVDGKAVRGCIEHASSTTPLHLVHVWATRQRLLLAQRAVNGAPGEVGAIPEMLKVLDVDGAVVSVDANGCTPAICTAIRERGADYVIALKGNRAALHKFVEKSFADVDGKELPIQEHRSENKGHGRHERRVVWAIELKSLPETLAKKWTDLRSAALVERTRTTNGKTSTEHQLYISSLAPDAARIADAIRSHWGIENGLHWTLDVAFNEDRQRIRDRKGAQNMALINRIALMLLKAENSQKRTSIRLKRKLVGWESRYLGRVLTSGRSIT